MRGECPSGKRGYGSEGQARRAHRAARWRIRAYLCRECWKWHVTNNEKL